MENENTQVGIDQFAIRLPARLFGLLILANCVAASTLSLRLAWFLCFAAIATYLSATWFRYHLSYFRSLLIVGQIAATLLWLFISSFVIGFRPATEPSHLLLRWFLTFVCPLAPLLLAVWIDERNHPLDAPSWPNLEFNERRNWARRIQTVESGAAAKYGLIAGMLAVFASGILKGLSHEPLFAVVVFLGIPVMLICILLPLNARLINTYRYVRRREKKRGRPYLIWDLDEIEEERSRSWLGRLCNPRLRRLHQSAQGS